VTVLPLNINHRTHTRPASLRALYAF